MKTRQKKKQLQKCKYQKIVEKLKNTHLILEGHRVHAHLVSKNQNILNKLKKLEAKMCEPIDSDDSNFRNLPFTWLFEPGNHFGFDLIHYNETGGNDYV